MTRLEVEVPGAPARSYPVVVTRGDADEAVRKIHAAFRLNEANGANEE